MTKLFTFFLAVSIGTFTSAEIAVPIRTIRANAVITAKDLEVRSANVPGTFEHPRDLVGQEARVALYAGRPIRLDDIGPPAIVNRNQIVSLFFSQGGLRISTEGRALARGGIGDRIRVMNLASRTTLFGQIQSDGSVQILR
ncbi:MAG: flagellar basal body P-ring formation chaperone FlgA [Paracoccaceae bacterium]